MKFKKNGIRYADFKFSEADVKTLREDWQAYAAKSHKYPKHFSGKGIVYTAGGVKYITCAWVSISYLRKVGCDLPIELWYLGNEVSNEVIEKFKSLDVNFRNFYELEKVNLRGYMLKPLAIINSSFEEVLFLDADNICVENPDYLFSSDAYKEFGCVFWPDYFQTSKDNSIWSITNTNDYRMPEQESGQILINKKRCWQELHLCLYFNKLSTYYYRLLYGDKDTFKFAWLALKSRFHMINYATGTCGYKHNGEFYGMTMVQHDPFGKILFLHRHYLKWDVTKRNEICWEYIKRFNFNPSKKEVILKNSPNLRVGLDLIGDVNEIKFNSLFGNLENECLDFLQQWRDSNTYKNFMEYSHFANNRYLSHMSFELDTP